MNSKIGKRVAINTVVFDFDGVLLQSNAIKRDVYFQVFETVPRAATVVTKCLLEYPDFNRVELIGRVLSDLGPEQCASFGLCLDACVQRYTEMCEDLTSKCAEVAGAGLAIRSLSEYLALYINSATVEVKYLEATGKLQDSGFLTPKEPVPAARLVGKS